MIQANELRIGNYGHTLNNDNDQVVTRFVSISNGIGDIVDPIPLTEDILLKCGASLVTYQNEKINSFFINQFRFQHEEQGYCLFGSEWTIGEPFNYLHQLQNLFFALTGEELNVEL